MTNELLQLSDDDLAAATKRAAGVERVATADLLALLIEVERRGLHLALGYSSMFAYCTRGLQMSEQAAYSRITAARLAKRHPQVLALLADGDLTLSSVGVLAPHLTEETADVLLEASRRKSTREVERIVANAYPQPDVPTLIRALPVASPAQQQGETAARLDERVGHSVKPTLTPPPRPTIAPSAPGRYLLKVTLSEDTQVKLQRARGLLRHTIPDGDLDVLLNRALSLLLDKIVRAKIAGAQRSARSAVARPGVRRIPAAVRREVWQRDCGRCAFPGPSGVCGETAFLEFHHLVPFAAGGRSDAENLQLRCRAHNAYEARLYFGSEATTMNT